MKCSGLRAVILIEEVIRLYLSTSSKTKEQLTQDLLANNSLKEETIDDLKLSQFIMSTDFKELLTKNIVDSIEKCSENQISYLEGYFAISNTGDLVFEFEFVLNQTMLGEELDSICGKSYSEIKKGLSQEALIGFKKIEL